MARMRGHLGIIILFCSAVSLLLASPQLQATGASDADSVWTVMVYMAADSEPSLPWEEDINEMEAGGPPDWMNVVALVDPLGVGDSVIFKIQADDLDLVIVSEEVDDSEEVIPSGGEVDMASSETLSDFISYAYRTYPADRLALVLWGHSGGWYGMCQDGSELLQPPELWAALETATDELGRKIDIIITDCCTEGVIETACEMREHADWYVGSEIAVPSQGLRYDLVLDSLADDRAVAPEAWGSMICETHRTTLLLNSWSATMAVYDLAAMDAFAGSIHDLSKVMKGYAGIYRGTLQQVLVDSAASDFSEWYVDTGDTLRRLAGADLPMEVRALALHALLAYDDLVYDFETYASPFDDDYADVLNYTGAAVYCPGDDLFAGQYLSLSFARSGWGEMTWAVRLDEPELANAPGPVVSYADTDEDGEWDVATLHWEQDHDMVSAHVFADTQAGLQLLSVCMSEGSDLIVSGFAGELIVSASAWDGSNATSHHTLDIALTGSLDVRVKVVSADGPVTDGVEVVVLTRQGQVELSVSDGVFIGAVTVPDDAEYGDLLTVEVRGKNGETVAQNRTIVTGSEVVLQVAIVADGDDPLGPEFIVPALLLITCAAAVVIYLRTRRGPREQ